MTAADQIADIVSLDRERKLRSGKTLIERIVAHWKCRVGICREMIGVGETAVIVLTVFNEELKRRRERAIDVDEIMMCDYHATQWREQMKARGR